jgi:hypothetical protein
MHFGASEKDTFDAKLFEDHLNEIRMCHKLSRGCFFLSLIGKKYEPLIVPPRLESENFEALLDKVGELGLNCDILENWYFKERNEYILKDCRFSTLEEWRAISEEIITIIHECLVNMPAAKKKKFNECLKSVVEQQFNFALGLAPGTAHHVLNIFRDWDVPEETDKFHQENSSYANKTIDNYCREQIKLFHSNIKLLIPEENTIYFKVPWKPGGINSLHEEHEAYLNEFKNRVLNKLKGLIKKSLDDEPELKSKKKIVEENFQENITHLTLCYEDINIDFSNSEILEKIKQIVQNNTTVRHNPILIYGNPGSGKTSLIQTIYRNFEKWFTCRTLRIIRFTSTTPRSSYNLELLRVICQQICIALKLPEGFLPKDASFDPLYINNWFQTLLRNFEDMNQVLVIFIDDLHLLNPLDSDAINALSWIPITLPKKVHMICTTSTELEKLRMTSVQKERFKHPDSYIEIPAADSFDDFVNKKFDDLEESFTKTAVMKLSSLITCSEYGLTETELLEILMPTSNSEAVIHVEDANFNFSSLCSIRRKFEPLLREKIMSGKLLIEWSHVTIKDIVRRRYLHNQETLRNTHAELANLFFCEFCRDESCDEEDEEGEPAPLLSEIRETPFQSTVYKDVTYSQRHIDEAWIHLLLAGDTIKLKSLCMCNYDFLLAALQTFSVSYLRCLLEHVRCYLLDREIELVYYSIRKSTDVLTRDTYQLGTQLISWLRPVIERGGGLMSSLVTSAMAWCDGFTLPLVVPLTDWLQPPLPQQSRVINTPNVRLIESTPSGQHVVCVVDSEPQLWHIMSNQLVHTFKGIRRYQILLSLWSDVDF